MSIRRSLLFASLAVTALATRADAETLTSTLTFTKGSGAARPIANARVDVYRFRPGIDLGFGLTAIATTDANGQLSQAMPFAGPGVMYQLRVHASNPAAAVLAGAYPFQQQFITEVGPPGIPLTWPAIAPTDVLDFSFQFSDPSTTAFFNIADAIQHGATYAAARRDPGETDTLGQVAVGMQTFSPTSFYDASSQTIRLRPEDAMNDFPILHEYAHHLQSRISGVFGIAAIHDGCTATTAGIDVMDPGFAWMEGFAEYFPQAVFRSLPSGVLSGAQNVTILESPSCPGVTKPRASLERFVAAALFDLMDANADGGDSFCAATMIPTDTLVFQIFDREMDVGFSNPSLQHFVNAWSARGLDVPMLQRTLDTHGITVSLPAPMPRYDMNPAANIAIFRPSAGQWWVAGGQLGVTIWGEPGDVPVPADYDGDGLTDTAIWRPTDGMWWIIKTGSNQISTQQWGLNGDIPLPGDYDGDNETDYAVYRPTDGMVYVFNDGCGFWQGIFVGAGKPVVGDFDGDGFDEPGVYNQFGMFDIALHAGGKAFAYLPANRTPLVRDFDGDRIADYAVFDPTTGVWNWTLSSDPRRPNSLEWGQRGDVPVPADYDGDGSAELAVWTPRTGGWRIQQNGVEVLHGWGIAGDIPVPAP